MMVACKACEDMEDDHIPCSCGMNLCRICALPAYECECSRLEESRVTWRTITRGWQHVLGVLANRMLEQLCARAVQLEHKESHAEWRKVAVLRVGLGAPRTVNCL